MILIIKFKTESMPKPTAAKKGTTQKPARNYGPAAYVIPMNNNKLLFNSVEIDV